MNQQKGFSLIEVLLSLMLMTTLALALMQMQLHAQLFLSQLLRHIEASTILDNVNESLLLHHEYRFVVPKTYSLVINDSLEHRVVQLNKHNAYSLTRIYSHGRITQ